MFNVCDTTRNFYPLSVCLSHIGSKFWPILSTCTKVTQTPKLSSTAYVWEQNISEIKAHHVHSCLNCSNEFQNFAKHNHTHLKITLNCVQNAFRLTMRTPFVNSSNLLLQMQLPRDVLIRCQQGQTWLMVVGFRIIRFCLLMYGQ